MQNEIIIQDIAHKPQINWRVYYNGSGQIVACAPTALLELGDHKWLTIPSDLGNKLATGNERADDYRVIQTAGLMKLIKLDVEHRNARLAEEFKNSTGVLRYLQIENTGDPRDFVIGLTVLKEKNTLVFQSNSRNNERFLHEIANGNIADTAMLFFTKKNEPSWLHFTIEIPIKDILKDGILVIQQDLSKLDSFSVFTEYFVEGFRIFEGEGEHQRETYFFEFINDLSGSSRLQTVDIPKPILDVAFTAGGLLRVSLNPTYRELATQLLVTRNIQTSLYVTNWLSPFIVQQHIAVDLRKLVEMDHMVRVDVDRPVVFAGMANSSKYIRLAKANSIRFADLIHSIDTPQEAEQFESTGIEDPIIHVEFRKAKIRFTLNPVFLDQLKDVPKDLPIQFTFIGRTMQNRQLNMKQLLDGPVEWDLQTPTLPTIYIDVKNPNQYFQIKAKR